MERLCLFIINNIRFNNPIIFKVRETDNESTMNLDDMRVKMNEVLDRTKISNLVMFPSNLGFNEEIIISFKYEGRKCEIKELIDLEYEELELSISAAII